MIVTPRRLIYPQSGYLGILPLDDSSIELLEQTFRHLFRKSPFEKDIRKYYLTRVDPCTNIRRDNKKVFRELVTKCYPDQPYLSYKDGLAAIDNHKRFPQPMKAAMRTFLTEMQRKQAIDKAFQVMEKQGIKTDDLLKKFRKLGINPIPLREGYGAKRMPSLSAILQTVGNPDKSSITIELSYQK